MIQRLPPLALGLAMILLASPGTAVAQGTFLFSNISVPDRPRIMEESVYFYVFPDGSSQVVEGERVPLSGSNWLVDVLVKFPGTDAFTSGGLLKVTPSLDIPVAPVGLFTGGNAGLFSGGVVKVPFVGPGESATVQVRVWDKTNPTPGGADLPYDLASRKAATVFSIDQLGGAGSPPTLPVTMTHFLAPILYTDRIVFVPEPSTWALLGLGSVGVLWAGRDRNRPR